MSLISKIVSKFSGLSQEETARAAAEKTITPGMPEILRRAAAEGAVLLKNDGLLPLENNETVALFGRVQCEWFYTGYGSGGDVNKPYAVNLIEGIRGCSALQLYEPLAKLYSDWSEKNPIDHGFGGIGLDFTRKCRCQEKWRQTRRQRQTAQSLRLAVLRAKTAKMRWKKAAFI